MSKKINSKLKIILIVIVILIGLGAWRYYSFTQQMAEQRQAMQIQRQKLVDYWQAQGLSQEEIDQKLIEERSATFEGRQPSLFGSLIRSVRHTTGGGFSGGPERGSR